MLCGTSSRICSVSSKRIMEPWAAEKHPTQGQIIGSFLTPLR